MNAKQFILFITFALLLFVSGLVQTDLKYKPQIGMVAVGVVTTSCYFLAIKHLKRICFSILLALTAYIFLFFSFIEISDLFYGSRPQVADIPAVIFAVIATPIFLVIYYKYINNRGIFENEFASIFSISSLAIFILNEYIY